MKSNKAFTVEYKLWQCGEVKRVYPLASNKEEAYFKAVFEMIPESEGHYPYSAWVAGVTYNNGNYHSFNTFEGMPY